MAQESPLRTNPVTSPQDIEFDADFGQSLCDLFQKELGYGCIFAGAGGRIVAASVRERIGTVHEIAGRIMAGEIDEYAVTKAEAALSKSMREGLNLAIDFEGRRVVNIGIAGPLGTVAPLARIARFCTVSLLKAKMLERTLGQRTAVTQRLSALSEHLVRESNQAGAEIEREMDALRSSIREMESAASHMHRESGVAASASTRTSENIATVAGAAKRLSESVGSIEHTVTEVRGVVNRAVEESQRTEAIVSSLFEAAGKIGNVVKLIHGIAHQTNLLALNATIEAARAGEAGKGFAVVAAEVKTLAKQSAQATEEIARQVEAIHAATRETVAAIGGINSTITQVNTLTSGVASAVDAQGIATADIDRSAGQAATGAGAVASATVQVSRQAEKAVALAGRVSTDTVQVGQRLEAMFSRLNAIIRQAETTRIEDAGSG